MNPCSTAWPGRCSRTTYLAWSRSQTIATGEPIGLTLRFGGATSHSGRDARLCCRRRRRPGPARRRPLLDALKSPFGVAEVPLRITTFTQKDSASDKARIVVAAEIGQPGGKPEEFTVGYVLLDSEGSVVGSAVGKHVLSVPNGLANAPRDYLGEIVVEPGNYSLRFGVVDASGRRGGVIREVSAWKLGGEEFAIGDLLIGDTSADTARGIRPGVEPHVSGEVAAFLEMYSTSSGVLDGATVNVRNRDRQGFSRAAHGTGGGDRRR